LSGRFGTVLIVTGLALFLVSLIPPAPLGSSGKMGTMFGSEVLDSGLYTPQLGLRITVETEDTLKLYMINFNETYIADWMLERFPEIGNQGANIIVPPPQGQDVQVISYPLRSISLNVSIVEEFLDAHPGSMIWSGETVDGKLSWEYEPTNVVQATVLLLSLKENPWDTTSYDAEWERISLIASSERLMLPMQILIPLGLMLVIPWIVMIKKPRNYKSSH
jgi:hypothetical protein